MNSSPRFLSILYKTKLKEFHLILMAFGLGLLIVLLGFLNNHLNRSHRTKLYELQFANQELGYAHIWLDEFMSSNNRSIGSSNPTELSLNKAKRNIQSLLNFDESPGLISLLNKKDKQLLKNILNRINKLNTNANVCINIHVLKGTVPSVYNTHDVKFSALKHSIDLVYNSLKLKLNKTTRMISLIQSFLFIILFIHTVLTILVIENFRKELIKREQYLAEAQYIARLGFYNYNFSSNKWHVSDLLLNLMGVNNQGNILKSWLKIIHPEDKQKVLKTFKESNGSFDLTYRILKAPEQKVRWIHHIAKFPKLNYNKRHTSMLGITQDITEKYKLERDLMNAFIDAQEQEKQSFGEDLHDGVSQILSAESMYIKVLLNLNKDADKKTVEFLTKIKTLNLRAVNEVRSVAHGLMSKQLKENGLIKAIANICVDFNDPKNIEFIFKHSGLKENEISKKIKINIFRITQEISTNILRHSKSKTAFISLNKSNLNQLKLIIKDSGVGMDLSKLKSKNKGAGLKNIERRVKFLNGTLKLETGLNKGTTYSIIVPL